MDGAIELLTYCWATWTVAGVFFNLAPDFTKRERLVWTFLAPAWFPLAIVGAPIVLVYAIGKEDDY